MSAYTYAPAGGRFVPGLKPGAIVETNDPAHERELRAHPCFSPVPEAETPTEPTPKVSPKRPRRK